MRRLVKIVILMVVLIVGVPGYGYWHAATHATLTISLHDKTIGRHGEPVKVGTVKLYDAGGKLALRLVGDGRFGAFHITYPEQQDCRARERMASTAAAGRAAWQKCFQRRSRWIAKVAPTITQADIRFGRCELRGIAVSLRAYAGDWFLWWVPLPHVGGKPYTRYSQTFRVDGPSCRVV